MRCSLLLALLLVLAAASPAGAFCTGFQFYTVPESEAGYGSPWGDCHLALEPGVAVRLHFFVNCEIGSDSLRHLEIRHPDWPAQPSPEQGRMDFTWTADGASGSLRDGLVLDWSVPRAGETIIAEDGYWQLYRVGSVEIETTGTDWMTSPLIVDIAESWCTDCWENQYGDRYYFDSQRFIFNDPQAECSFHCTYQMPVCIARHFDPPMGALVPRDLVPFSFEVFYFNCMGYFGDYEGTVSLGEEILLAFAGDFHGEHTVDIDFRPFAPGAVVPVRVDLSTGVHYTMDYIIDDTATARASFSAIKAQY
jgi:hypothetical protein